MQLQKLFAVITYNTIFINPGEIKASALSRNLELFGCAAFHTVCNAQRRLYCSWIKQSFVKFPLPENAIRGLFPHHEIKTALEDGVRPGTGMKKKTDQRGDKKDGRE